MYIFNGKKLSEEQAIEFAEKTGRDLQTFLEANPDIEKDPDFVTQEEPGKKKVAAEKDATAVTEDTASQSEDGSSELPFDNSIDAVRARKNFKKQEEIAIMQDPIELEEAVVTAEKPKSFDFWKKTVLSSDYEKAFEQLSKDTGEYSSVKGDGSFYSGVKNIGEYVKQLSKAVYQPMLTEEETTYDPINIDLQTRIQIAKDLTPKDLDKLKKGGYTLKEKEDLLRKSKSKVVEKALYSLEKDARRSFEKLNEEQKVIEDRLVSTFGEIAPTSESFVTQASVDLYNNLNKRLNDISNQKKEIGKEYKADTEELEAEYGFNLASGVIDNSFKLTDEIKEFNKSVKENIGTDLTARLVGGLWKTAGDIVTFPGVVMGMAGDLFTDQDTYSSYDAFQDVLFNLTNYNTLGDPGEAEVLDEDGKYVSDPKQYARMTADMLPFTLGIIASAARGNTKGIQQTLSKAFPKRGIDKKLAQDISMGNAAFTMTFQDNVREGEEEGLSKGQAIAYGGAKSLGTAISQAVMPDVNFLKSTKGLNILKDFKGSLKSAANKKALSKASGQFFTSIGKELGEEEIEFVLDKANKISFGLALGDYDGFVKEQKQLFAGTLMLSGGLGSFGATATGKAVKKQIYSGIIKDQQALLNELQTQRIAAERSGNLENAEQLKKAEIFATDLIRASKVSPENVTTGQLDLVVEKQKLINEKKKLDSSFHGPINEKIAAVDKQISESKVAQTKEEVAGKIKKGVEKLGEKLGFAPKRLKDNTAVEEYLNEVSPDKDNVKRAGELGFFVVKPDGSKEFVINEEANAKEGVITTEAHEALHYVLYESVKNSPESQTALGEALIEELKKIDQGQIAGSDFANRLSSYLSDPDITTSEALEEALTLFSEATLTGDIVYNENVMTKIGDFIRQTLQAMGIGQQIVFNDGRDVFNFIKDYNNSIKKGRADNFITEVAKKPVGKLVKPKTKADLKTEVKESRSTVLEAINELVPAEVKTKEEFQSPKVFNSVFNSLINEGGAINNYIRSRSTSKQEAEKAIESVQDRMLNFDPAATRKDGGKVGVEGFGEFIFANTNFGKMDAKKALFKEGEKASQETSLDAPEATTQLADEVSIDETKVKSTTSKLRRVLGIKQDDAIYDLAKEVSGEILSGDLPGKKVKTAINKEARKSKLRKAVSDLMGTEKAIDEQFLNKNILEILKALPASDLVKLEREAKIKVLAEQGPRLNVKDAREAVNKGLLPKDTNLQSGPKVSSKLPTTLEQAKEFFTQKRKAGLVNVVTEMLVKDAAPEVTEGKMEPAKRAKVLSEIDRAPTLKFSKKSKQVEKQFAKTPEQKPGFTGKKAQTSKGEYTSSKNGEVKNYVKIDENSDDFKVITETLNSFLDKHPEYYPYFRYSTTGTRGTTFENIDKFNEYIDKKEAKVKVPRKKYHKNNFLDKGLLNNVLKTLNSDNKAKLDLLQDIFLDIESFVNSKQGADKAWVFEQVLLDAQKDQNHFLRILVPFGFYPVDLKTGKPLYDFKATEEHADPAVQVGRQLLTAAINGNVKEAMKVVRATSMQGSLLKLDDDSLKPLGLNSNMPKAYFDTVVPLILEGKLDFLPDGFASLIRYTANNNINPFQYKIAGKDQTIGEFFLGKIDTANMKNMLRFSPTTLEISSIANELITSVITGEIDIKTAKQRFQSNQKIVPTVVKASKSNNDKSAFKYSETPTNKVTIDTAARTDKALDNARDLNAPVKKIRVFDFDDTLAQTKSDVLYTMPDGTEGKLNAEQFASDGSTLLSEGAVFDFSEFNKVTEGKKGPLFKVAQTIAAKRGTEDVFVLTARAPESQLAIYEFLKSQGLDIPLKNITGLGNSTGDAKARWIVDKAADGYNDFYFADDAPQNVKAVKDALSVIDVKSKTQQAKIKFSKSLDLNKDFNDIIENKTGIGSDKTYSRVKAEVAGANKGKFNFFIPPSAEDFVGLLYSTLGKGDVGDAQMAWYKSHLLNPFARAMENLANDRASMMQDFRGLKKALKIVPKNLRKKIKDSNFTKEQAVRAYIWDKQGMEIPGISQKDQKDLVDFVNADAELVVFGDQLIEIGKGDAYAAPDAGWVAGTIDTDFIKALNTTKRSKYLETWQQNVDQIFSEANLNKLEAAYGANYREAMVDMLKRMETGRNTSSGSDRLAARFTDWLTNSVGAIMFFNTRSAVLQTISAVNFINFSDNNVLKAGQAFANQPQYWSDFKKLFNSPFLLDRRSGLKLNVNEADIAAMAKGPGNGARNVIAGILKAGFLPTQIADSFAIASGGAAFYRNRIKALEKEGLTRSEAEEQAFRDFREIAEESQQSSRPDKISQQQAGPLGRVVLAFANTPAQYARLIKKAGSDLKNGRGDAKTNISKIIYYGVAQNLLFSSLQQALFAIAFDDEEEEEKKNEKYFNIVNGMSDSVLRGTGIGGAVVSVVKNTAIKLAEEADKKSPKYQDAVVKGVLQISPPVSSKVGKLQSAGRSFSWNQEEMRTRGFSIDNPAYLASANVVSALTNVPLDRAVKKVTNIVDAGNEDIEYYKRVALALGWSAWELGIDKKGGKVAPPKTNMDKLYDLNKKEQIDSLLSLGLSKKQIKLLKKEEDRVKAILDPKSIKKIKVSKRDSLFGLNKKDQIQALERLGLNKKEIRALRLESDRVEAIINKQKQEN